MRSLLLVALLSACASVPVVNPIQVEAETSNFDREQLTLVVRALEDSCPLNGPWTVYVGVLSGQLWGSTVWDEERYVISIDARQPMYSLIYTLIHEWAHAMVWDASQDPVFEDHGPMWGVAYARSYRVAIGALLESKTGHPSLAPGVGVGVQSPKQLALEGPQHDWVRSLCGSPFQFVEKRMRCGGADAINDEHERALPSLEALLVDPQTTFVLFAR